MSSKFYVLYAEKEGCTCMRLTNGTPIRLRKGLDPKNNANASMKPIPAASNNAVETDDNCFLSETSQGLPLALSL